MTERKRPHRSVPARARKRAIRAHAARAGVPYSVAARLLDDGGAEPFADQGHTVYPAGSDEHRQWLIDRWRRRPFDRRVADARQAASLPLGRAEHLVQRFPTTRGEPGTGVGPLYDGEARPAAIGMLYAVVGHEQPTLVPDPGELAWIADLGEESGVDFACAALDRAARRLLADDRWQVWRRVEAAVDAGRRSPDRPVRDAAHAIGLALRTLALRSSVDGGQQTLDALLVAGDGGHAPGTRVRMLSQRGRPATIVGAHWPATEAPTAAAPTAAVPTAYDVRPDGLPAPIRVDPRSLTLLGRSANPTARPTLEPAPG